ncbi:hypothetical protein Tsubulata_011817 [Turnera subulata]|uniref:PWWP domain-containing protein n=1 Tax=Turnera subulata TaxID=218843 RepID=A0A9Q0FF33_9ROSI|nr:hypothetical protein Tsubulata_011817 [Turnera subulata]
MAPSRRRGAAKAAAAAAARRQWKVGDLVLAKVKGFPAWPAKVSEPEEWGYQTDLKKVLVHFFGTQQIAFCNPVDVEAFTEEKKQSLLTKRQGKGADFVRAVQEIVDVYEKSKKQDQVDELNSGPEVTLANGGNSVVSSAHIELKDRVETSEATTTGGEDHSVPVDVTQDVVETGSLHEKDALSEQPTDTVVVSEKSIIATYTSRKRSGGLRSRKPIVEKKVPSVERSRTSSRLESARVQNSMICNDAKNIAADASNGIIRDRTSRRSKRMRKSPEDSEWDDEDSSAFVSNCSIEDNGSEIVTVESDSFSLNEGSTIDSGCRPEHSETFVECLEGDVHLSKGLDFQIQAVVIKKKRKLNRKRASNEAAEPTVKLEREGDLDIGLSNSGQYSHSGCENVNNYSKEDGDKHLPLVKRARVRMGKPSFSDEEHNDFSQAEEKYSNEFAVNLTEKRNSFPQAEARTSHDAVVVKLEQVGPSVNCTNDSSVPGDSSVLKEAIHNSSPPRVSSQIPADRPLLLRIKESQSFGNSADDEAALPPSKRLHRALEAMSANAAQEGQAGAETPSVKTSINGCSTSGNSLQVAINSEETNNTAECGAAGPGDNASCLCSTTISEESAKLLLEAYDQARECTAVQEPGAGAFPETMDQDGSKDNGGLSSATSPTCTAVRGDSPISMIPDIDDGQANLLPNNQASDEDEGNCDNMKARDLIAGNLDKELCLEKQCGLIPSVDGAVKVASQYGMGVDSCSIGDGALQNTESFRSQIGDNSQISGVLAQEKDAKSDAGQIHVCMSDNNTGDKLVLDNHSSPFQAGAVESPIRMSPSTTPIGHVSTAESANIIQNTCCSSPNISSNKNTVPRTVAVEEKLDSAVPQRLKVNDKGGKNTESLAALSSFEGVLGSLTRTKDSIGRATRLAIDCAKFGVSAKVMEILSRTLESESNLHRRVDIFFLVDSIAQCSRGLKGDGGVYPSAIQAVLPRLLSAAAPPGSYAYENRRQCLKASLEIFSILPESVIRHHMRELDSLGCSSAGPYARRSARTERALDDPVRDMEGMLVDEYGSNSSFQLPGFCMPCMIKVEDDGSDSDGGTFEAVTPEHNSEALDEKVTKPATEKHTHILEDVDGELEMEDVAPSCEAEIISTSGITGVNAAENLHVQFEQHFPMPFHSVPQNVRPSSPPFPPSPPPPPPPPPPPATARPSVVMPEPYVNAIDSKVYTSSQNMHDDMRQSVPQHSVASRMNPSMSNAVRFHGPEFRDQMQICESTSSYGTYPVHQTSSIQHSDGPSFHRNPYPPRPPHPPPSSQFSYVQGGQHMKSRRDTPPPSYSNRYHSSHNFDGANYYDNHERTRSVSYEPCEDWRFHTPSFPGPRNQYKGKGSYAPAPYGGPPREPNRFHRQDWEPHSRGMHHRHFMPFRPPSGGAIPVANR